MENTNLESLYLDFEKVKESLRYLSQKVIREEISDYPIFVAAAEWIEIGKPLFDREEVELNWFFFASILEEFEKRNIIKKENIARFKSAYGDASKKSLYLPRGRE